jgi:hypothetical protein
MNRAMLAVVPLLILAAPAHADVKIVQSVTGKGMGMSDAAGTVTTTYIKGLKMRTDTVRGGTTRSMVFDIDAQTLYMFDNKRQEADVLEMGEFGKQIGNSVDPSQITASVRPNGQTKQLLGKTATGCYLRFYKAAAEKGWIFGDPRVAKGFARAMAAMMAKMGGIESTSRVQSVDTAAIADSMFAPPAGYKLNVKK